MSLIYIGAFPPKWGGVTVKNNDLFIELVERGLSINKIDLNRIKRKRSIPESIRLAVALVGRNNQFIIGISAGSRKSFSKILFKLNKKAMRQSIMIVMGGAAAQEISNDSEYMKLMAEYKRIYVETHGMYDLLVECGMRNVSIYPNCRKKAKQNLIAENRTGKLKCVFFSLIQKEKGVDNILKSAEELKETDFYFYGSIDNTYQNDFEREIKKLPNCFYKGLFKGTDDEKYLELAKYDVLLLPTRWTTEGIPGILVEAKIAGLSCIVSNVSYNSEIVTDGVSGIVLAHNNVACLTEAVCLLSRDRRLLENQKRESYKSANEYYIENYVDDIIREIRN